MNHIFLYGPPGSGKSSAGRVLADGLNMDFLDLDTEIETFAIMSIPQIMEEWGEKGFRDLEFSTLTRVSKEKSKVISLGGGALLRERTRARVEASGVIVYLETNLKTLIKRLSADENVRPLLDGSLEEKLDALLVQRASHYESFKIRVNTTGKTPEQVASDIQHLLGRYHVRGMGQGYDVLFYPDSFDSLVDLLREKELQSPVAIVCDENVAPLYGNRILTILRRAGYGYNRPHMITIPAGEEYKTLDSIMKFWRHFLEAGIDRKSTVLALGGGVIGDLGGFAASTFMRGVPWVNLPTTLLSMVDASTGGKTGFDLPEGKNLIGSFYPPRLVLVNPNTLYTLPESELRSGLAEVVKHGVIADPELFEFCSRGIEKVRGNLGYIVRRGMAVKIDIIQADPYERGIRSALNLGHTIGHAVELVSGFRIRHGEAVSIGMVAEARLAERLTVADKGLSDALAETLTGLGLPVEIPKNLPRDELVHAMQVDKKKASGVVRFALPVKIGEVKVGIEIDKLEDAL
jgi:3-dehydroquinate synthase